MADSPSFVPPTAHEKAVLKWSNECILEGEAFLRSQQGYDRFEDTVNAIMGEFTGSDARPASIANISLNYFGKVATDLVASETDIKPFWDYRSTNKRYQPQTIMANKLAQGWWNRRHCTLKLAEVLKYANAMGTGYAHHIYNSDVSDQDFISEDPRDVIPIRPSSLISIQDSFGVMVRRERTVNYMKTKYPHVADRIRPDRDASYANLQRQTRVSRMLAAMGLKSSFVENLYASLGGRPAAQNLNVPTCDEFTIYVKDDSRNETGSDRWMGLYEDAKGVKHKTNWTYKVPPGDFLYPRKRCLVITRNVVCYDDTSIYWHGLFPLTKLTIDPWPWSWLGKAPLKDLLPLHAELNRLMRIASMHWSRVERPGLNADKNSISQAAMNRIDTARAGLKIRSNPVAGRGIELLHEPPLDPQWLPYVQFLKDAMDDLSGRRDVSQLMNLGQMPAGDTVDKLLELMSPSIRLRSQVIEAFMEEFARIVLSNFFQFYTKAERLAALGPDGLTFEDFDFDPDTLIPDMVEEFGYAKDDEGKQTKNPIDRAVRAREFLRYFTYQIAPGSLLASASIMDKMMYVQLFRMGILDGWTLLDKLNIPNVGEPPSGANNIMERVAAQMQMGIGQTVNPAGRKASGQAGPRQVIKESR